MATRIRLQRHGKKGKPFFHIVAADSRSKRDGRFIECELGIRNWFITFKFCQMIAHGCAIICFHDCLFQGITLFRNV